MKHYHLQFTEQNGEQGYVYDYLFKAKNEDSAWEKAKNWIATGWRDNYDGEERVWNEEDICPTIDLGIVEIRIDFVSETTVEKFKNFMVKQYHFGAI